MISFNNNIISNNLTTNQSINSSNQPINKSIAASDIVSISKTETMQNKDKQKLMFYIVAGITVLAGILITIINLKKGKKTSAVEKSVIENAQKTGNNGIQNIESKVKNEVKPPKINGENIGSLSSGSKVDPTTTTSQVPKSKLSIEEETQASLNRVYDAHIKKMLLEQPELKPKETLIREVFPDLIEIKGTGSEVISKEVLEIITPENKDFIIKQAIPAFLRNEEVLDLKNSLGLTLKNMNPETADCLDKLACNVKKFKITGQSDVHILLKSLTKENKDFAFNELFPFLADNAEKFKIKRGGHLAKYLEVITPENKEFMLNEAIPAILESAAKLDIDATNVAKIAKYVNKDNLGKIKVIADNLDKYSIKDEYGFLDAEKIGLLLNEK